MPARSSSHHSRPSSAVTAHSDPPATSASTGWPLPSAVADAAELDEGCPVLSSSTAPPAGVGYQNPSRLVDGKAAVEARVERQGRKLARGRIDAHKLLGHGIQRNQARRAGSQVRRLLEKAPSP